MKSRELNWKLLASVLALVNVAWLSYLAATSIWVPTTGRTGSTITVTNPTDATRLLQAQIDLIEGYHSDVLTIVWGSIATVATVISVVAFAGLIQSARVYERDKAGMQQELRAEIEVLERTLRDSINTNMATAQQSLKDEAASNLVAIQQATQKEIADVKQTSENNSRAVEQRLQTQVNELTENYLKSRVDMLELEARSWEEKGILSNALRTNMQRLEYSIKLVRDTGRTYLDYEIEYALGDIRKLVEEKKVVPDADDAANLLKLLKDIPDKYELEVRAVTELVERARAAKSL